MEKCLKTRFVCTICQIPFSTAKFLEIHNKNIHSIKYKICELCGIIVQAKNFSRHTYYHQNSRPFECGVCKKIFKTKYHLQRHGSQHQNADFHICSYCNIILSRKDHLLRHMKRHHSVFIYNYEMIYFY